MLFDKFSSLVRVLMRAVVLMLLIGGVQRASADPEFLEPEQAFRFTSHQVSPDTIDITYQIADGYYMYRERFKFTADGAKLGEPVIPPGSVHFDETFQKDVETYRKSVTIHIPILSTEAGRTSWTLTSRGQGCSDQGLCYAPLDSTQQYDSAAFRPGAAPPAAGQQVSGSNTDKLESTLRSGRMIIILPLFFLLGLGLAFTPCVLPMMPILSSIIVGEGEQVSRHRGFVLSLSYSLGMAIVYTALGVAAGLLGQGLAAALQNPWVLGAFSLLLVALSLSMFDVYHLQVPHALQSRLSAMSGRQRAGKLVGVFAMGAISGLIVGPCVAAPLASALLYISQTHNVVIGGSALFAMAMGMSVPLLLIGLSAGSLLPRAGHWMNAVKRLFGVLMLAMAIWLVSPVLSAAWQMMLWAVLCGGYGAFLLRHAGTLPKAASVLLFLLAGVELAGVAVGARDPFAPFSKTSSGPVFVRVHSVAELEQTLANAKAAGKPVVLDFYADWCVSCKEMEKLTFSDPRVAARLAKMVLLQADVTADSDNDKALLKRFNLFGPPGTIFFAGDMQEVGRVVGFQPADQFDTTLKKFTKF